MSHSPQPSASPSFLLTTDGELYGESTPENRELVRRIHACCAACEGISTQELEQGVVADMRRVIEQVAPLLRERAATTASVYAAAEPMAASPMPAGPRLHKAA